MKIALLKKIQRKRNLSFILTRNIGKPILSKLKTRAVKKFPFRKVVKNYDSGEISLPDMVDGVEFTQLGEETPVRDIRPGKEYSSKGLE
jgi:hypothetical protein